MTEFATTLAPEAMLELFPKQSPSNDQKLNKDKIQSSKLLYRILKRFFGSVIALLGLILLLPVLLIVSLLIVLDDPKGGALFVQERVGLNGEHFRMYKFRTMYTDAEERLEALSQMNEMDGPAFKIKNDPRITRVGSFLRRSCIDELPQLFNVLKGDMALVGPRPPLPREVEQYNDYQRQRLYVLPGLTCYWQIQPHRNDISFDGWMAMDMQYIKDRGMLTDIGIILKTARAVFGLHGC